MEPASNENVEQISDELSKSASILDELNEAKAKHDVIRDACFKTEVELEDLFSPVRRMDEQVSEASSTEVLETIEKISEYMTDQWYPMKIEMQQNIIRLQEDALSKRINQLNDDQKKLDDLENDVKRVDKENLDLEALIEATEAELRKQREMRKFQELKSSTLSKEVSEREAEYGRLENAYVNSKEKIHSENVKLQAIRHKKNITAQKIIAEEAEYRNQLDMSEYRTIEFNDYKAAYERKLEKNQRIELRAESIQKQREEAMEKLNRSIDQNKDTYVKFQNDYEEVTNQMISEFGDVESFPQMILEAKSKLAKFNVDCQTINSTFNAEYERENETEKREVMLLAKQAELKRKLDKMEEQFNAGQTQNRNENDPIASSSAALNQNNAASSSASLNQNNAASSSAVLNQNNAVETEHEFVQPHVPNKKLRKLRKSRSQRPKQTAAKAVLNVADTTSVSESVMTSPQLQEISYAESRRRRSWHALQLYRENCN